MIIKIEINGEFVDETNNEAGNFIDLIERICSSYPVDVTAKFKSS